MYAVSSSGDKKGGPKSTNHNPVMYHGRSSPIKLPFFFRKFCTSQVARKKADRGRQINFRSKSSKPWRFPVPHLEMNELPELNGLLIGGFNMCQPCFNHVLTMFLTMFQPFQRIGIIQRMIGLNMAIFQISHQYLLVILYSMLDIYIYTGYVSMIMTILIVQCNYWL